MPNFALANGLWIGSAPNNGTKINNGKRILIARYQCRTILFIFKYTIKAI